MNQFSPQKSFFAFVLKNPLSSPPKNFLYLPPDKSKFFKRKNFSDAPWKNNFLPRKEILAVTIRKQFPK